MNMLIANWTWEGAVILFVVIVLAIAIGRRL